jgi:hypothetical protein
MLALLIWACLAGHPDDCRVIQLPGMFPDEKQCVEASTLMVAGWLATHPGA